MSPSISYEPFVLLLSICLKSCDKVAKHRNMHEPYLQQDLYPRQMFRLHGSNVVRLL